MAKDKKLSNDEKVEQNREVRAEESNLGPTLAEQAKAVETPTPSPKTGPKQDPNGGPKSTPETYEAEMAQKKEAFDKRETYLDINNPDHANMTYAQLQEKAGADVKNQR